MPTWKSRGLRGSTLETILNHTNELMREKKLALITKIPTPITPVKFNKSTSRIDLAYFQAKSTVDYVGAVQGYPVCFDAKECAGDTFALSNLHDHQIRYMEDFESQGGISFFLIYFSSWGTFYYLSLREAESYLDLAERGGLKHIKKRNLKPDYFTDLEADMYVNYLKLLDKDISERE